MKREEIYSESVRRSNLPKQVFRRLCRELYINVAAEIRSKQRKRNGLSCIMGHYVFDDQCRQFEEHIKQLVKTGEFLSTEDALSLITGSTPIDGNYFHLSFDDGLECLYRNAASILHKYGIKPIVFINSAVVDGKDQKEIECWRKETNYAQPLSVMSWGQLLASGFEIGAHTRTHRRLSEISTNIPLLWDEIVGCKSEIENRTSNQCNYFAWPFGTKADIDATAFSVIKNAGFKACFSAIRSTIKPGLTDPYMIPRQHFEPQWSHKQLRYFLT